MTTILGLDPGTTESGWCVLRDGEVANSGVADNEAVKALIATHHADCLAIEMMEARGMPLGKDSLETVYWTGRFVEAWERSHGQTKRIHRRDVKLHLCGSCKAKDSNIRQALIDLLGPPGTKKQPGPTFGVKSHAWAALAVAVYASEMRP